MRIEMSKKTEYEINSYTKSMTKFDYVKLLGDM